MTDVPYGMTRSLVGIDFDAALDRVTKALAAEGFGVLTDIDVRATMKKKLDVDLRDYRILGACNPPLAHAALEHDPMIGLLLPCNVIVFREDDDTVTVSAVDPAAVFEVVDRPGMKKFAAQVAERLSRALDSIAP
jgi:uncharacterized protein (DUF302 family)